MEQICPASAGTQNPPAARHAAGHVDVVSEGLSPGASTAMVESAEPESFDCTSDGASGWVLSIELSTVASTRALSFALASEAPSPVTGRPHANASAETPTMPVMTARLPDTLPMHTSVP